MISCTGHRQANLLRADMKKSVLSAIYVVFCAATLAGCGGAGNYTIMERQEGPAQVTYRVQVKAGMPQSEVDSIARELEGKENGKSTMVNFYDGPRSVENMIYTCQGGTCYDSQPNR